jgi:7-keto-8-aminopelargonate synthetase-like enzyme
LQNADDIDEVGGFLDEAGIYVTLAAYPLVPRAEVGFRIQVTAANGDDEIDELCGTLHRLCDRFPLQHTLRQSVA